MKKFIFMLSVFCFLFFAGVAAAQQTLRYPIKELGYCRDAKECYLYCEIPANKATCWSYGRYVLGERILGQHTSAEEAERKAGELGITFPVAELGNCGSVQACMDYCNQPENHQACVDFARAKGLHKETTAAGEEEIAITGEEERALLDRARTELGCTSIQSCQEFCEQNIERCMEFGRKHAPPRHREQIEKHHQMLEQAKQELGCTNMQSCQQFCNNPNNAERCMQFAKRHAPPRVRKEMEKMEEMMTAAKTELGCTNFSTCSEACQKPENQQRCMNFALKHAPPEIRREIEQFKQRTAEQARELGLPCDSFEACKTYCEQNPDKCRQFSNPDGQTTIEIHEDFTCSTEEECKRWCEQNPDKCPGFQNSEDFKQLQQEQKRLEEFRSKYEGQGSPQYSPYPTSGGESTYYQEESTTTGGDPATDCANAGGTWTGTTCEFASQ